MTVKAISSGTVFKTLVDLATKSSSESGTKVSAKEVKLALDSFNWGDGKVTKTEVIAAKRAFDDLKAAGKLTQTGQAAVTDWFAQVGTGVDGGFSFERSAQAFETLTSQFRWGTGSQSGATFTRAEAQSLLSVLGAAPSPARIADVTELAANVKASGQSTAALKELTTWLQAHPIAAPSQPLLGQLSAATKDLLWPSETDRPVYPVNLGAAPTASQDKVAFARKALGEPDLAPVEIRSFDDTLNQLATSADPNDAISTANAAKFGVLRDTLKNAGLTDLTIVRVGTIDIDVYALGRNAAGQWVGVCSGVVET
jgi:hypothetical protein